MKKRKHHKRKLYEEFEEKPYLLKLKDHKEPSRDFWVFIMLLSTIIFGGLTTAIALIPDSLILLLPFTLWGFGFFYSLGKYFNATS